MILLLLDKEEAVALARAPKLPSGLRDKVEQALHLATLLTDPEPTHVFYERRDDRWAATVRHYETIEDARVGFDRWRKEAKR